jgi:predicted ester cyclase
MQPEALKARVHQYFEQVWNNKDLTVIGEFFTPDLVVHDPNFPQVTDFETNVNYVKSVLAGYPDILLTIEDQIAEGDKVVTRYRLAGTNTGRPVSVDLAPTGKRIQATGMIIYRFVGNKVAESWAEADILGIQRQLGAIPTPSQSTS